MEILFGFSILALIGLAYYSYQQVEKAKTLDQGIQSRDEIIKKLRSQLRVIEKESAESKALFSTIADVAFDITILLDNERVIISHNAAADVLFNGISPIGEKLDTIIDSPDLLNIVRYAIDEEDSLEEQFVIGESYYRARTHVMNYDNDRQFIGVAMQDITRLVQLNRARRDLVANISHELRTPITRIRLIIEGLFHEDDKPKRKASIQSLK